MFLYRRIVEHRTQKSTSALISKAVEDVPHVNLLSDVTLSRSFAPLSEVQPITPVNDDVMQSCPSFIEVRTDIYTCSYQGIL